MITDRKRTEERTGVQTSMHYGPDFDLQPDFVMCYRLNESTVERIKEYKARGFLVHLMTGVSWGQYADFLDGEYDGQNHWDQAQVRMDGTRVMHSVTNPYLIPSIAFADYLTEKLKIAVDAGVDAVHLEEPEIWSYSGYSEGFKREYELYYKEPWRAPHESADAFYRAGKLKAYLYTRTLGRVADGIKEYAQQKYGRTIRFIVPTHSLINYTQYGISSPESMLIDLPAVDGYIAQVWTGTSNVPNVYQGIRRERVFEAAFLEFGIMQELTRGTGRNMWFLQDPIDDVPNYSWDYYRASYLEILTAALLQPHVSQYEVCPWPHRVITQPYPRNSENGTTIPAHYLTTLLSTTQALRDMEQPFSWMGDDACVGILLSDTMLYQRTCGVGYRPGIKYDEFGQESNVSGFYGMALPLLTHGIHAQPVQLENVRRFPGYLDGYNMLCLSYEFMKPEQPDLHYALVEWVNEGGTLVLIGDGSDPFGRIRHWWNQGKMTYDVPMRHLTDALGLGREPAEGVHAVGKGHVAIMKVHPAQIAYDVPTEEKYLALLADCRKAMNLPAFKEKSYFGLRRGPYIIGAALRDSKVADSFHVEGRLVDLTDAKLKVVTSLTLKPGEYCLLADLDCYDQDVCLVGSAGRVEDYLRQGNTVSFRVCGTLNANCELRFKCPAPVSVTADAPIAHEYETVGNTLLLSLKGNPDGVKVTLTF